MRAEAVAVGIRVGEYAGLQHLVRREADAGNDIGRREGGVLDLGKIVFRVAVELQHADLDRRVVGMRPDLGQVERVVGRLLHVELRHDLHLNRPARESPVLDRVEQCLLIALAGLADDRFAFLVREELVALLGLEVELDPVAFARVVPEGIGVRAVAVHMHRRLREAAVGHQDRHLMQAFRRQGPVVPHGSGGTQIGLRMTLLRVDEVGELVGIANEEDRRIVADEVPVAFPGVEFKRETADVALVVGGALFAGNGREAGQHRRFGAGLETFRSRILRDVAGDFQRAESTPALGMDDAFRNALAVLMRQLLDELIVLQHDAATRPCRQ